jgi:hypothetical protein
MERSVKTDLSRSPTVLFNGGVRFQSARAARLARVRRARAAPCARSPVRIASAAGFEAARQRGGRSLLFQWSSLVGTFDDREARLSSRETREPSFYRGLIGPLLRLELRGGIAYPWDLRRLASGPASKWMLTLEPCPSPGTAPAIIPLWESDVPTRETGYEPCFRCFVGSYSSLFFHIERTMVASLRASVSLARFGFVPAVTRRVYS